MSRRRLRVSLSSTLTLLLALGALAACSDLGPTGLEGGPIAAAKGGVPGPPGGGGGGDDDGTTDSTEDPVVDSVDPDSATRDTTLDVLVQGDHFEEGSVVEWELDGEPTTAIVTEQTSFVNGKRLTARIRVSATAPLDRYDVAVRTPRGRRGVGIELFAVKDEPPIAVTFSDRPGDEITSDGRGTYDDRDCGVGGRLNLGDAILSLAERIKKSEKECDGSESPRVIRLTGFPESSPGGPDRDVRFLNVDGQPVGTAIERFRDMPIGTTFEVEATFQPEGCPLALHYSEQYGADWVEITRESGTTWTVRTKAAPANRAACLKATGNQVSVKFGGPLPLDFELTVVVLP